jgi:Membrane proteins related to metalloendopeptidases
MERGDCLMALGKPTTAQVSQKYGGNFGSEPEGWFVRAGDGRPLKGFLTHFPGSIYQHDFHKGVDLYAALGTPIIASEAGTVVYATASAATGYAKVVRVRIQGHGNVFYSSGHLESFAVKVGQVVARGQLLGRMGKTGNANGVHDHFAVEVDEKGSDGITRRMCYSPLRFLPASSYKWGTPYGSGYLPGGDLANDDRIYPIHNVTVGAGVNIRQSPDTKAPVLLLTTVPVTMPQINEVAGGSYTLGGVAGTLWAKVKLATKVGYVAKPLVK